MSKSKKPTFWLMNSRYIMLTGDDWQGTVYVALSGETPEKVCEHGLTIQQMKDAEQVEPWAVPLEWWRAFSKLCDKIPENPPEQPKPEPQAEAEEELLMHVAAGTDLFTAGLAAADSFRDRAYQPREGPCMPSFFSGALVAFFIIAMLVYLCQ